MTLQKDKQTRFKARVFYALSDSVRLEILEFLRSKEKCVCEIVLQVGYIQPVVSRHLRILKEAGFIKDRKDGTKRMYSITQPEIFKIIDAANPNLLNLLTEHIIEQLAC